MIDKTKVRQILHPAVDNDTVRIKGSRPRTKTIKVVGWIVLSIVASIIIFNLAR